MEVNEKNLKEFKKKLKSIDNEFEREVGSVLANFVGVIELFPFELYYHREISLENEKMRPDYFIRIRGKNKEDVLIIELKKYANISAVLPQLNKFYQQLEKLKREPSYSGVTFHPLFVIDSEDDLTAELNNRANNYKILIEKADLFSDLEKLIETMNPQYALLDFLKNNFNIQVAFDGNEFLEFYAVENNIWNAQYYTFVISARDLLRLAYVYRAAVDKETQREAYQRTIDGDRLNEIKKFILSREVTSVFPNNIICTLSPDSRSEVKEVEGIPAVKRILIENKYSSIWVIDGQHRLYSLTKLHKNEQKVLDEYKFLITVYKSLKAKDQAKIFSSINNENVGINPNLICYILSQLLDDKEGAAARVSLDIEKRDVLDCEIYCGIKGRYGNWLNLKTFVDYLSPNKDPKENLIDWDAEKKERRGWLQKSGDDISTPVDILAKYFECIADVFPTDWKKGRYGFFQSNAGIAVSLKLLAKIIVKECNYDNPDCVKSLKKSDFTRYLQRFEPRRINKKIKDLELEEWRRARNKSQYNKIFEYIWSEISGT